MRSLRTSFFVLAPWTLMASCSSPPPSTTPSAPSAEPPQRFGQLMSEVGHRFERLGMAGRAGAWELAAYDVHELEEVFEEDMPHARPPAEVTIDLVPLAAAFASTPLPELSRAIEGHDTARFETAFASTATACNACHQATGHGFIVVPTTPGEAVPVIGSGASPPSAPAAE